MNQKKKILIVDDEAGFTRMVRLNLEKTGRYEVLEENHALRAVDVSLQFKPDLILLDVIMPGNDGGDVAAKIRANSALKNVPMIFLTAVVPKRESGEGGLVSGGFLFLSKPVKAQEIIRCIEERLKPTDPSTP